MYSERLESLIEAIIADGEIEENELLALRKASIKEGEDPDEVEIVVKGRLAKMQKTNGKLGNVMFCPSCGAQVIGGKAFCPECGYNFSNVKANSSAEKLAAKIQEEVDRQAAKEQNHSFLGGALAGMGKAYFKTFSTMAGVKDPIVAIIENFPVPNTREDLLDFLSSLQGKAKKKRFTSGWDYDNSYLIPDAYWRLYCQCINKAKISFLNDPDFKMFFDDYNKRK